MGQNVILDNGSQLIINTDTSKIFIWDNRTEKGEMVNSGYVDIVIPAGTVLGRISATGMLVPFTSGATDGSQYIVGILFSDHVIEGGDTKTVAYAVSGDVDASQLTFQGSDTLETVVAARGRRIKDILGTDTVGIRYVYSTEQTEFDNPSN